MPLKNCDISGLTSKATLSIYNMLLAFAASYDITDYGYHKYNASVNDRIRFGSLSSNSTLILFIPSQSFNMTLELGQQHFQLSGLDAPTAVVVSVGDEFSLVSHFESEITFIFTDQTVENPCFLAGNSFDEYFRTSINTFSLITEFTDGVLEIKSKRGESESKPAVLSFLRIGKDKSPYNTSAYEQSASGEPLAIIVSAQEATLPEIGIVFRAGSENLRGSMRPVYGIRDGQITQYPNILTPTDPPYEWWVYIGFVFCGALTTAVLFLGGMVIFNWWGYRDPHANCCFCGNPKLVTYQEYNDSRNQQVPVSPFIGEYV